MYIDIYLSILYNNYGLQEDLLILKFIFRPVSCRPQKIPYGKILQINSENAPVAAAMGVFFTIVIFSTQ